MDYMLVKYVHMLAILVFSATLTVEHMLLKPVMTAAELKKLARVDMLYGLAAAVVIIAGLLLWFVVGKGAGFYSANPVFHFKLALFLVIALLSVYPTVFFLKARRSVQETLAIPKKLIWLIRLELLLLVFVPLPAVLMAQGYGLTQ